MTMLWWSKWSADRRQVAARFDADLRIRAEYLNRILERERTRADRTGRPLSMILLGYDGRPRRRRDASAIVAALKTRSRITDEVGWFDKRTGFAVLPDTPAAGGRRFAEIVCQTLKAQGVQTSYAIYQYGASPPNDPPAPPDSPGRGGSSVGDRLAGPGRSHKRAVPALAFSGGAADTRSAVGGRVHRLEPLMAQRLPWWKRSTDVVFAGAGLLAAWPTLVAIGIAIRADSPGPVIFRQRRCGLGGRPFDIWKFRTMVADAERQRDTLLSVNEQDGPAFKIRSDPRVTRIGAWLRRTSLDELPQLVNVLRGEMTLVGPRPLPVAESHACEPWQRRRMAVTPGLTCIWQVWGRSRVTFSDWCRMDLRYTATRTLVHDLKIMLATVPAVLKQRGAC
ncbi:MAG: sugar transferase [Planctomycetota bacterium]